MKRPAAIAIVIGAMFVSAYVLWLCRPQPKELDTYGDMGADMGFDRAWYRKVGDVIRRASTHKCSEISPTEYDNVYILLKSEHELAQLQALLVLANCPPSDKVTWYSRIHDLNKKTHDPGMKLSTFGILWDMDLSKHKVIRAEAKACTLSRVAYTVAHWPDRRR